LIYAKFIWLIRLALVTTSKRRVRCLENVVGQNGQSAGNGFFLIHVKKHIMDGVMILIREKNIDGSFFAFMRHARETHCISGPAFALDLEVVGSTIKQSISKTN
jgi:hypothetical protein